VRLSIKALNDGYKSRGFVPLHVISGDELLKWFIDAQGQFLPNKPHGIRSFLELYMADGRENICEEKYADYVRDLLTPEDQAGETDRVTQRRIAAALMLTKYSLLSTECVENHVSVCVSIAILMAHICYVAEMRCLKSHFWSSSLDLCWHIVLDELAALKDEVMELNNDFVEGNLVGDGDLIYKARTTILLGWLSAYQLILQCNQEDHVIDRDLLDMIGTNFPDHTYFWGESASIHFLMMVFVNDRAGNHEQADMIRASILRELVSCNSLKNKTTNAKPDTYCSVDQALAAEYSIPDSELDYNEFKGSAYTLQTWIDCVVRANLKSLLKELWYDITYILDCEFYPDPVVNFYLWRSPGGENSYRNNAYPEKWSSLVTTAFRDPHGVPSLLEENLNLLILFLMAYPHRTCSNALRLLDIRDDCGND
jgi:hypothetical protein